MVPAMLIYLLKANIALTLFFLAYRFGLRKLTFYTLNRIFLLAGIAFSSLFPLISVDTFVNKHKVIAGSVITYVPNWQAWQAPAPVFTVWNVLVYIFWTGVSVMAIRFFIQLFSLWRIHRKSQPGKLYDITVQLLQQPVNPFSFFRHIYINPSLHQPEELPAILRHEKVHVKQWHTADTLLGELNNIFYWFNPGAWLMKTAIRENLEFITDRYLLQQGVDKVSYQYNLVKVSGIPYATAIANNFNLSHLKKRIMMMNSKKSSRYQVIRYMVLGLLVGGTVLSLNYTRAAGVMHYNNAKDSLPTKTSHGAKQAATPVTSKTWTDTVPVVISSSIAFSTKDSAGNGKAIYVVNGNGTDVLCGGCPVKQGDSTAVISFTINGDNLSQQTATVNDISNNIQVTVTGVKVSPQEKPAQTYAKDISNDIQVMVNGVNVNTQHIKPTQSYDVKTKTLVGNSTVTVLPGQPQTITITTHPIVINGTEVQGQGVTLKIDTVIVK